MGLGFQGFRVWGFVVLGFRVFELWALRIQGLWALGSLSVLGFEVF